jgi:hypothetical protein
MENSNNPNEQQINQQFNQHFGNSGQSPLPNGTGALVLGIISTVFGVIWCYWIGSIVAITCGIIAISMAKSGKKLVDQNPNGYTQASIGNNNAGKIMGIIGVCLGSLAVVAFLVIILVYGALIGSLFGASSAWH